MRENISARELETLGELVFKQAGIHHTCIFDPLNAPYLNDWATKMLRSLARPLHPDQHARAEDIERYLEITRLFEQMKFLAFKDVCDASARAVESLNTKITKVRRDDSKVQEYHSRCVTKFLDRILQVSRREAFISMRGPVKLVVEDINKRLSEEIRIRKKALGHERKQAIQKKKNPELTESQMYEAELDKHIQDIIQSFELVLNIYTVINKDPANWETRVTSSHFQRHVRRNLAKYPGEKIFELLKDPKMLCLCAWFRAFRHEHKQNWPNIAKDILSLDTQEFFTREIDGNLKSFKPKKELQHLIWEQIFLDKLFNLDKNVTQEYLEKLSNQCSISNINPNSENFLREESKKEEKLLIGDWFFSKKESYEGGNKKLIDTVFGQNWEKTCNKIKLDNSLFYKSELRRYATITVEIPEVSKKIQREIKTKNEFEEAVVKAENDLEIAAILNKSLPERLIQIRRSKEDRWILLDSADKQRKLEILGTIEVPSYTFLLSSNSLRNNYDIGAIWDYHKVPKTPTFNRAEEFQAGFDVSLSESQQLAVFNSLDCLPLSLTKSKVASHVLVAAEKDLKGNSRVFLLGRLISFEYIESNGKNISVEWEI